MVRIRNTTPSLSESRRVIAEMVRRFGTDYYAMSQVLGIAEKTALNFACGTTGRPTLEKAKAYLEAHP